MPSSAPPPSSYLYPSSTLLRSPSPSKRGTARRGSTRRKSSPTNSRPSVIAGDRKSTRLNSSHLGISYAVFCSTTLFLSLSLLYAPPISFAIEAWNGTAWVNAEKIQSDELTTVGHRRLIRLKSPVTTEKVRIRITGSRLEPTLAELGLFKQSIKTLPPTISDRSTNGAVSLSNLADNKMVYTIDGSAPTTKSPVYTAPITLPLNRSVTVRAASLRIA